jgi:hypothetical protein
MRKAQNTMRSGEFGIKSQNSSIIYKNLYDQDSERSGDEKQHHLKNKIENPNNPQN